jgi:hypothetical protein
LPGRRLEPLGKRRKEFVPPKRDEGRKAERAGASESKQVRASYPPAKPLTENHTVVQSPSLGLPRIAGATPGITFQNSAANSEVARSAKFICIRPIPPHPKSTLAHPKSTVDLEYEPLIKVENDLSPAFHKPKIRPENKGIQSKSNRHKPKNYYLPAAANGGRDAVTPLQGLASKMLHPICVDSRNSRKKLCALCVSVAKQKSTILILLFSLVHSVEANPSQSNLIEHFWRKKHMHHPQFVCHAWLSSVPICGSGALHRFALP